MPRNSVAKYCGVSRRSSNEPQKLIQTAIASRTLTNNNEPVVVQFKEVPFKSKNDLDEAYPIWETAFLGV
jgi:hypothetical protein